MALYGWKDMNVRIVMQIMTNYQRILLSGKSYIYSSFISPPLCRSQAVVFVSTPRMYLRSRYFLVKYDSLILILKIPLIDGFPIFWLGDC